MARDLVTAIFRRAHAVIGACQMLIVGKLVQKADPFALNAMQLGALAVVALPVALILEPGGAALPATTDALLAFGYLAVFSTVIA